MNFLLFLGASIILYSVAQCKCGEPFKKTKLNVTNYFLSKLPDLDPLQDRKVLFDKSYAVFFELISMSKVFEDDHDLVVNHSELFSRKLVKDFFELIKSNLNNEGQFTLYPDPEFSKITFLLKLEDYPVHVDYF